jgi:hypothetical protein
MNRNHRPQSQVGHERIFKEQGATTLMFKLGGKLQASRLFANFKLFDSILVSLDDELLVH